jgi:hypothetical protein
MMVAGSLSLSLIAAGFEFAGYPERMLRCSG